MKLYIDLNKAQETSAGVDTPKEDQTIAEYDGSYARRYEGVAPGEAYDPDDPEVGGKYSHTDEESQLKATKDAHKQRSKESKADGVTKADFFAVMNEEEDQQPIRKTLSTSNDLFKSLNTQMQDLAYQNMPNPVEVEFLVEQGYNHTDIVKGMVRMTPWMRNQFTDWLCSRLPKTPSDILGRR